jgi:hypothetical protein
LLVDLVPNVVLVCADQADAEGNLYTGPNTEDTPVIVEAAAFHDGIVIVQVNQIVDKLPRVDIPASWVDVVVEADGAFAVEPLFTRDPRQINDLQILIGMMVIRGPFSLCSIEKCCGRIDTPYRPDRDQKPKAIYVSNRRARALRDPDGIREDLATNIAHPVRWHDATTAAYERGIRFFVELPPGHTLTDLASTEFPDARSIALSRMQIDSAVKLIKRRAERIG